MRRTTTARAVGALFLTATAAGVLSAVLLGPLDTLTTAEAVAGHADRLSAGALMVLVMAGAIAMIPPMLLPVLKEHGEALALGYLVARTVEVVLLLPAAIGPLLLVAVPASGPDGVAHLGAVRVLVRTQEAWGYAGHALFFCLSALLLNTLLLRSRLVPRWLSGWALLGVLPYLLDACLVLFGMLTASSTPHALLLVPLAVNEMALAGWLLAKGFRPVAA